jgi:tetratricopeptide (TPR) repeat protein
MGTIHRATDRVTREAVAIKVMSAGGTGNPSRFAQEATVLAALSHPAIVRYVAHGSTEDGALFLAMEWLEGEDLSERLARLPLTVAESLSLIRRACEGVCVAHAQRVVHRDIKPSNLFLVGGDPARVKVLDFGIARHQWEPRTLTQPGTLLGTVGYMSPEQAMGPRGVDVRTDVFGLGCVLFECLTGRPAFAGSNAVAVLAKVLREEPPRVGEMRPELGAAFDALVARMLAKDPDERPSDAAAVLRELDRLERSAIRSVGAPKSLSGLTGTEQKIVSVILGRRDGTATAGATDEDEDAWMSRVRELTRRFDAEPVAMRGGGLLVVLSSRGAATDQARQAATCALLLRRLRPELALAVATGRVETMGRIPVGIAIDKAASLLDAPNDRDDGVAVDELTAGLLDSGFHVQRRRERLYLVELLVDAGSVRLLMGKPTPFVGREKELGLLELTLRECEGESVARAVLVTGPPGQGKSRLRQELVVRVGERGNVRILIARSDPVGAGSAFLVVRQILRQAMGLREGNAAADEARLRAHVARVCASADAARIADFLCELIGSGPAGHPSPELRAARNDPQVMGSWLRRSFVEWLLAECAAGPLLIVLEDLHWGDQQSVAYLGDALHALAMKPLMILALARPEIADVFPKLWPRAEKQEISLGRLTPRAAERLVRAVAGDALAEQDVALVVDRADGNAFYLEELIRHVAEGGGDGIPETVLALVQSRLERLEPEARLVVRAASVFGEVLWQNGVAALVHGEMGAAEVERELLALADSEVLVAARDSRFPDQREYHFRHGLLRDAAYAMLTETDRTFGHRIAGAWLERTGEKDALTLADHLELGGEPTRAVPWLIQAAQAALDGFHLEALVALVERGNACSPGDAERGVLAGMRAVALVEGGDPASGITLGRQAMALLPVSSPQWLLCAGNVFAMAAMVGDQTTAAQVLQAILGALSEPVPSGPQGFVTFTICGALTATGELDLARAVLERAEALLTGDDDDPVFVVNLLLARSYLRLVTGDLARALSSLLEARALADRIDLATHRAASRCLLIGGFAAAGSLERAEVEARELASLYEDMTGGRAPTGRSVAQPRSIPSGRGSRRHYSARSALFLAAAQLDLNHVREAISLVMPFLDAPDRQVALGARSRLAHALLAAGDLESAAREATAVIDEGAGFPSMLPTALGALALIALRRGQAADALALVDRGIAASARGSWLRDGSILRLARAEALHALGRVDEARVSLREARQAVLHVAATLEPELRSGYLTHIAANARTLELASQWLD